MAYDYHTSYQDTDGSWCPADHHAPLHQRPWDTTTDAPGGWADFSVKYLICLGASPIKLNLGIPFYGQSWNLSSTVAVPPAPANGKGYPKKLGYKTICADIKKNTFENNTYPNTWVSNSMGPYAFTRGGGGHSMGRLR